MYNPLQVLRDERLRDEAAGEVVSAILADAERAPAALQSVLFETARRLFDPGFPAASLAELSAKERRDFRAQFRKLAGCSHEQYVAERRLTVGDRLVRETELGPKALARLLGFGGRTQFRKKYQDRFGQTVAERRAALPAADRRTPEPRPGERMVVWRQMVTAAWVGVRGADAAVQLAVALDLLVRLAARIPEVQASFPVPPGEDPRPSFFYETWKAVRAWLAASDALPCDLESRIAYPMPFDTLALAELMQSSPPAALAELRLPGTSDPCTSDPGTLDPVTLGRLALASLKACEAGAAAESTAIFRVGVCARLARLTLSAGDERSAERLLADAELTWRQLGNPADRPAVEAELLESQAELRQRRGDHFAAASLFRRARPLYRRAGDPAGAVRCLDQMLKHRQDGAEPAAEVLELEEAIYAERIEDEPEALLRLVAELAAAYVRTADPKDPEALAASLTALVRRLTGKMTCGEDRCP